MKILLLHTDYIEYEAKEKAVKEADEIEIRKDRLDEALAVFVAVEKDDEDAINETVKNAAEEVKQVAENVKVDKIMLYPYAHLSSNLSSPKSAKEALRKLKEELSKRFAVKNTPFGWYKAFKISCKGHPMAELSREIKGIERHEEEKKITSSWFIFTSEGELIEAEKFDFSNHKELEKFYEYEAYGNRKSEREPAHIKLMKELNLVDYEPGSDPGNMRWYPKGKLVKKLLERKVEEMCLSAGAMEVETPLMYDAQHPALSKYLKKFPARQYRIKGNKDRELFMRFAACFGQYLMASDMVISYKNLPLRIFELAKSFRKEQHGELSGIKRLRSFTMPDMHTLCADKEQALEEFKKQFLLSMEWTRLIGLEGEVALRFVRPFFEENREFAMEIAKEVGKPILMEIWDKRYFYFITKFEFNMNDSVGKSFALSTVQIDVENPESFDITYTDENGERKYPLLLHASISGGIDRCICALLEKEAKKIEKGGKGMLPFWLSPTQVRLIPVGIEFLDNCIALAEKINGRVDIDDRDASVSKKIREAEKEWVPIIIVYGEKERNGIYRPRCRFSCEKELSLKNLNSMISEKMEKYPLQPLSLPALFSKRPSFR
ncbi:MAG: threonine--tRNA ligase [Candidatus Thermoplasmatota archaeon]|nr:threonine--tRNA ligase [Candidatus Thermoplasmatota archaeon]